MERPITERQFKAIYALHKALDIPFNGEEISKLTKQEASELIDKLKEELERENGNDEKGTNEEVENARIGLVIKLILNRYLEGINPSWIADNYEELTLSLIHI